jgi:hypothetical protein
LFLKVRGYTSQLISSYPIQHEANNSSGSAQSSYPSATGGYPAAVAAAGYQPGSYPSHSSGGGGGGYSTLQSRRPNNSGNSNSFYPRNGVNAVKSQRF